jgi:phospholipid/cholesterol/gamma-HCH transport system substrate-binding protein
MERDVRYLLVGVAVIALLALFVGFVVWQAGGLRNAETARYTVLSEVGVAGLESGSLVRYLGVRVGQVQAIRLSDRQPGRVEVDIQVQQDVPVTRDTVATFRLEGITGQSYLDLATPDPGAPPPETLGGARYPVLRAEKTAIDLLVEESPRLVAQLSAIAASLEAILDEDNRAHLAQVLGNVAEFTARLEALGDSVELLADSTDRALAEAVQAFGEIGTTARAATAALEEADRSAQALRELTQRLDELIARNESAVDRFAREGLGEAGRLMQDARRTIRQIERLAAQLTEEPSRLLRGREPGGVDIPE